MGLLDSLTKNADLFGEASSLVKQNPDLIKAAAALFSREDNTVGGGGGIEGILAALDSSGLNDLVSSWVGSGANQSISADQLSDVLGGDTLSQFAGQAGIDASAAGGVLASLLPSLVDQLSPEGKLPDSDSLQDALKGLLDAA